MTEFLIALTYVVQVVGLVVGGLAAAYGLHYYTRQED